VKLIFAVTKTQQNRRKKMLETVIQELTIEIRALRQIVDAAIITQGYTRGRPAPTPTPTPTADPTPTAPETAPATFVEIVATATKAQPISREELTDLVLKIIRDDRSKQELVRQTIGNHGAPTLADIHVDKLPALKLALEALR
jgi:hypothetical protein